MRIHFGPDFDGPVWGGVARAAAFDEQTCGPRRLTGELEGQLGLPAVETSTGLRAAALLERIAVTPGTYWQRSAEADALATAVRLIRDYDDLTMAGWRPEMGPPRLRQLAELCARAPAGRGARLRRVLEALSTRKVRLRQLVVYAPLAGLPGLWREVVAGLAAAGTEVSEAAETEAASVGDLGAAARRRGALSGDGSLQVLKTFGAAEAADHVAAWLAAGSLEDTVIVTPDVVLDTALARHGLPTLGLHGASCETGVQLAGLAIGMAWAPIDPQRALELLSVTPSFLSDGLRRRLLAALAVWPAVGSPDWQDAAGAATPDERRALEVVFTARFDRRQGAYTADELAARCDLLETFFAGLASPDEGALGLCATIRAMMAASPRQALGEAQMQRLMSLAMAEADAAAPHPAQAGASWVASPAALVAPAERVVWWNFLDEAAQTPRPLPIGHGEREVLARAGMAMPAPGAVAALAAASWRRPLMAARRELLLVAPSTNARGAAANPHPLLEELVAPAPERSRAELLGRLVVQVPRAAGGRSPRRRALRPLPLPATRLEVRDRPLTRDHPESPSSLETLLGCSFRWALRYVAGLGRDDLPVVTAENRFIGTFAHQLLEGLVENLTLTPAQAAVRAGEIFDERGPRYLAPLFLPAAAVHRGQVRGHMVRAAAALLALRDRHGWRGVVTEHELTRELEGRDLQGRPDLLLARPAGVVDIKWGRPAAHREKLSKNIAVQLAAYSYLSAADVNALPPVAYFVVEAAMLFTADEGALPGGVSVGGSVTKTWHAFRAAILAARGRLGAGTLTAAGNVPETETVRTDLVEDAVFRAAPPCKYCNLSDLCGRAWGAPREL